MKVRFLACLVTVYVLTVVSFAGSKTVTLTTIADSDVRNDSGGSVDYALGNRSANETYYDWSSNIAKVYVKFALPVDFGAATAATFKITCSQVTGDNWLVPYDMYGLNDSAAGNDWQDLAPGTYSGAPSGGLTWNNAPANLAGLSFDSTKSTYLGRFTEPAAVGTEISFSTTALLYWLNTDSGDKVVTLMFVRRVESGFGQFSTKAAWISREGAGTYAPPKLDLTYTPGVVLGAVADSDIRTDAADYAKGDRPLHDIYYDWSGNISKVYVKFALPSDFDTAQSATFTMDCNQVTGNNWFVPYDVYGLNDNVQYNNWTDLNGATYPWTGPPTGGITWNNAPGNVSGLGFDPAKTTNLGRFTDPATAPNGISFSSIALLNWLNTDTDKTVTLMIVRRVESGFGQFSGYSRWVSREGTGTPPRLELFYNRHCPQLAADLNGDCYVDFKDLALFAGDWLK
jgi:hypothetical protein